MESEIEPVARPVSLLEWVNTFKVLEEKCESFSDLSSGKVLLKCLSSVMQERNEEQPCSTSTDPWSEIWSILEEFCNSSLTKVISLDEVLSGNEEHIARVVVLLLCFAVQKMPNEDIIKGITSLNQLTQWNIMFFIESALAKVKSSAISSGTFTSGIGERLPSYESHELSVESLSQPATPIISEQHQDCDDSSFVDQRPIAPVEGDVYKFTPQISHSSSRKALFYDGLDSPAGALWLKSPAIMKSVSKVSSLLSFNSTANRKMFKQMGEPEDPSRQVCVLEHHIRVLQNTIDNNKKRIKVLQTKVNDQESLFQECSAQLISKTEEYSSLESNYHKLTDKLQELEELKDLRDELDQRNEDLARVEKSLARYQAEVESLQGYKKRSVELEEKLEHYESVKTKAEDCEQRLEQMIQSSMEASSTNKRLELELKTTAIEIQAKSSEMARLLEQNKEMNKDCKDWSVKCKALEEMRNTLQSTLNEKMDTEQSLLRENRELTSQLETLQGEAANHQTELDMLTSSRKGLEEQHHRSLAEHEEYQSQVKGLLERLTTENEQMKTKVAILEGNIEAEQFERKEQLARKEEEISQLKTSLLTKEIEFTKYKEESEAYSASLDHEKQLMVSDIATKDGTLVQVHNDKAILEEKLSATEQDLEEQKALVACKEDLMSTLESEKTSLQEKAVELTAELQTQNDLYRENQAALVDVQSQLKAKEDTVSSLGSENASLEQKLDEALAATKKEMAVIQNCNDEVSAKLAATEQELTKCKDELSTKSASLMALADEKTTLEEQLNTLHSEVCGLQDRLNDDGKALEECQSQLADKETALASLRDEKHNIEEELGALQNKYKDSFEKQSLLQEELDRQGSIFAAKEEEVLTLSTERTKVETRLTQAQTDFTAQVVELQSTVSEYQEKLASKEGTLLSLTNERDSLKEDVLSLEREYHSKREADSATLTLNQQTMTDLQNQVDNLKEELEDLSQSRDRIKELYRQAATEVETNQKEYASQVETLLEQNRKMQAEREESYKQLREDNHSILQKQNHLYEQLDEIRQREEEAIGVAHEYERALRKEQTTSKALREELEDVEAELKEKDDIEELQLELNVTKKKLVKEQKHLATVIAENKSLEIQLNYASQKLRDFEKSKAQLSPPVLSTTSRQTQYGYEPRSTHEDEFYTHSQSEFNVVRAGRRLTSTLPFKIDETFEDSIDEEENIDPDDDASLVRLSMLSSATMSSKLSKSRATSKLPSENKQDRITELQRRNALALPHLKTSYPVETQVQPENLRDTNELIKNGRPRASHLKKKASHQTYVTTSSKLPRASTAFEISLDTPLETRPRNPRKRFKERHFDGGEDDGTRSPAPSRRRISAPPTPQPRNDILTSRPTAKELRRNTMAPSSFKLREFLDERQPLEQTGTSFTVNFSPPKKARVPKRLQENHARMTKDSSDRRATISKKKPTASTAVGGGVSIKRKTALKAKN